MIEDLRDDEEALEVEVGDQECGIVAEELGWTRFSWICNFCFTNVDEELNFGVTVGLLRD